jgi:hypothetical protein
MLPTFVYDFGLPFTLVSLRFYGVALFRSLGLGVVALVLVGFYARIIMPPRGGIEPKWASAASLLGSFFVFHCTIPAGAEERYLIAALPFFLMFFVAGADFAAQTLRSNSISRNWRREIVICAAILVFAVTCFHVRKKISYGFGGAAAELTSSATFQNSTSLVSSDNTFGEGIFISEVAMTGHRPGYTILRASKILADDNWNGTRYRARFATSEALMKCVEMTPISYIVLDAANNQVRYNYRHHEQLWEIFKAHPDRWKLEGIFPSDGKRGSAVYVYHSSIPPQSVMSSKLVKDQGGELNQSPPSMHLACETTESPAGADKPSRR